MDLLEAMEKRHSVRAYTDRELEKEVRGQLEAFIQQCNRESGLHMQLVVDEPKGFDSLMAHYGKFSGVKNYIAVIGKKSRDLEERCGYYGEKSGAAGSAAGPKYLLGGHDVPENKNGVSNRQGRKALPGDRSGLWENAGRWASGERAPGGHGNAKSLCRTGLKKAWRRRCWRPRP